MFSVSLIFSLTVSLDIRDLLSWLPKTVSSLTVRGFHLLRRLNLSVMEEGAGPAYPHLRHLSVTLCGTSGPEWSTTIGPDP